MMILWIMSTILAGAGPAYGQAYPTKPIALTISSELAKWGKVIKAAGIKAD